MSLQSQSEETEASGESHGEASRACDLCGTPIYKSTPYGKPVLNPVIRQRYGSAAKVEISLTIGEHESDWDAGEITSFDLCPPCFEEKLAPWLERHGARPKTKSWCS